MKIGKFFYLTSRATKKGYLKYTTFSRSTEIG